MLKFGLIYFLKKFILLVNFIGMEMHYQISPKWAIEGTRCISMIKKYHNFKSAANLNLFIYANSSWMTESLYGI